MTAEARAAAIALVEKGFHPTPLEYKSKATHLPDWQKLYVTTANVDTYFPPNHRCNIGLLLGTEVADGVYLIGLDIDTDDALLISRVRIAIGPNAVRKKGLKGVTIIARTTEPFPKKAIKHDKKTVIDILAKASQTVIPPSIHPSSTAEQPVVYEWVGKPLTEVRPQDLPLVTERTLDEIVLAVKNADSPFFKINDMSFLGPNKGGSVDDALTSATAVLVGRGWKDDEIKARIDRAVRTMLHQGDPAAANEWDDRIYEVRLAKLIASARAKGFEENGKRRAAPAKSERRITIVEQLIEQLGGMDRLWRDDVSLRRYENGHWVELQIADLEHKAVMLDTSFMEAADAEAVVRTVVMRSPERPRAPRSEPRICLTNGTLDVMSGHLLSWNSGDMLTAQLPFPYDPDADCPVFEDFLKQLFTYDNRGRKRSDEEIISHCQCYLEFLGLSLVEDLTQEKMMIVKGPPGCGKTTLARVFSLLHDPKVISTVGVHKVHEERYITTLVGKLVNVSGEIPAETYIQEEVLKSLISGDGITVRKLYEEVKNNVIMQARFFMACNETFRIRDTSGAVERRLIILETRHSIPEHSERRELVQDKGLFDQIRRERAGILNLAVAGLKRLKARGRFDPPVASQRAKELFSEESNHIVGWIKDRTHQGQKMLDDSYILDESLPLMLSSDLYSDYALWAEQNGHRKMSSITWGTRLSMMGYPVDVKKIGGKAARVRPLNLLQARGTERL